MGGQLTVTLGLRPRVYQTFPRVFCIDPWKAWYNIYIIMMILQENVIAAATTMVRNTGILADHALSNR